MKYLLAPQLFKTFPNYVGKIGLTLASVIIYLAGLLLLAYISNCALKVKHSPKIIIWILTN